MHMTIQTHSITDSYVSIDLETTGLNPRQDRIIEIGAVKVIEGQIADSYSVLVNPGRNLEEHITELTGIRDEQLRGAPYIEEVLPEAMDFLEDLPLLGHSILFDFSFLKKAAVDRKLVFEKKGIDTLKIARKYLADLEHRSLDYLCQHYGIEHRAHRALEDARATHFLYWKLIELFYEKDDMEQKAQEKTEKGKNGGVFDPHPLCFRVKRDTPATKAQREQLYRLLEQHKIVLSADVERLTRSEASRWIDKIRSKALPGGGE